MLDMAALAIGKHSWIFSKKVWPWLNDTIVNDEGKCAGDYETVIYEKFDEQVMEGKMTLDELIDFVRSIEPPEPADQPPAAAEKAVEVTVEAGR